MSSLGSKSTPTLGQLKMQIINQINKNSNQFIEEWKHENRSKKALILANRQQVLQDICDKIVVLSKIEANKQQNLTKNENKNEANRKAMLDQLRSNANNEIYEDWKIQAIDNKRRILDNRHAILTCISENDKKNLKSVKKSKSDIKNELLCAIRKNNSNECLPNWKENEFNQKRISIENKNELLLEIEKEKKENDFKKVIKNKDDSFITSRSNLLNSIRDNSNLIVESWKQENRNKISSPMLNRQLILNDLTKTPLLKSTSNPRTQLLNSLNTSEPLEKLENWKNIIIKQRSDAIQNKNKINCEIYEANKNMKTLIEKTSNRAHLLEEIRQITQENDKIRSIDIVEGWKQDFRNEKSRNFINKRMVIVDLLSDDKKKLKRTMSENDKYTNLLNSIRTEPIPAWKQRINNDRVKTIQNKKEINTKIEENSKNLNKNKNQILNKQKLMSEIRQNSGNFTEGWKEEIKNDIAGTIGNKELIKQDLIDFNSKKRTNSGSGLKNNKDQIGLKNEMLKELRYIKNNTLPNWREQELEFNSRIQGSRQVMLAEITNSKNLQNLKRTSSSCQIRNNVLADIRRGCPIPSWQEIQRIQLANIYNNKRAIMTDIVDKNFKDLLENSKTLPELKCQVLKDIRNKNVDGIVPLWKEDIMSKRAQPYINKVLLNHSINALKL